MVRRFARRSTNLVATREDRHSGDGRGRPRSLRGRRHPRTLRHPGGEESPYKQFWREEYRLNAKIASFPKPYVVVMDGIVMGGGVGISAHGNRRLVTERTRLAMPETGIGFIPDVGATWLLTRDGGAGDLLGFPAPRRGGGCDLGRNGGPIDGL